MTTATLSVMMMTVLAKISAFAREIVLSYAYGASAISDAYLISQTIPRVIFSLVASGLATGFIPMYSRILSARGRQEADRYTSNLVNVLLIAASIIVAIILFLAKPVVKAFSSGFSGETLELAAQLTRVGVFGIYFNGLIRVFAAYLRVHNNFVVPALVGLPANLVIVFASFLSARTSIHVLALGTVVATASEFLICLPFLRRTGYRYRRVLDLNDEHLRTLLSITLPVIVGTAIDDINVLVDRTIASAITVGGISALNYANRLTGFVQSVFVLSLTTVLYPALARVAADGDVRSLKSYLAEAMSLVGLLVVPATVGAMVFSRQIVGFLFGRGSFSADAVGLTSSALRFYAIGMTAVGLRSVLIRVFYSLQDTKTPMMNSTLGVVTNVVLNMLLSRFLGIGGLALATSIGGTVSTVLMLIALRRKIGPLGFKAIAVSFLKIIAASSIMGLVAYGTFSVVSILVGETLALVTSVGVGIVTYAALACLTRIPVVLRTLAALRQRLWTRNKHRRTEG